VVRRSVSVKNGNFNFFENFVCAYFFFEWIFFCLMSEHDKAGCKRQLN